MSRPLVIVGAGGFGREVAQLVRDLARAGDDTALLGFVDGDAALRGAAPGGLPVLGDDDWLIARTDVDAACGIGLPAIRRRVATRLAAAGIAFVRLVHPAASVGDTVDLGPGSIVCAGAVVTADVHTGPHVQINPCAAVMHDVRLGAFTTVAPGATLCGGVAVGELCLIGAGAVIRPGVRVGPGATVGVGAVVTRDVADGATVAGSPARPADGPGGGAGR